MLLFERVRRGRGLGRIMEVFDQVKKWNLSVSLSDDQKRLKIHPWSTVTTSQKQWFVENKQAIIDKIKSVGEGVFQDRKSVV